MLLNKRQLLLHFLLCILTPSLACAEMVAGTVLSVDRDRSVFVLGITEQHNIEVHTAIHPLPGRVASGKKVRIWGTYNTENNSFTATDIRGPGRYLRHDPTGARARITSGGHCPNCTRCNTLENSKTVTDKNDNAPLTKKLH